MSFTRVLKTSYITKAVNQFVSQMTQNTRRDFPLLRKINPFPIVGMLLVCRQPTLITSQEWGFWFPDNLLPFSLYGKGTLICLIKHLLLKTALCLLIECFPLEGKDWGNCCFGINNCRMKQISNLYDILTSPMFLENISLRNEIWMKWFFKNPILTSRNNN